MGFPGVASGKESACQCRRHKGHTRVLSQSLEALLEQEMATQSNILAWKIQWTEEPGGLQSMGSQKGQTCLSKICILSLEHGKLSENFF